MLRIFSIVTAKETMHCPLDAVVWILQVLNVLLATLASGNKGQYCLMGLVIWIVTKKIITTRCYLTQALNCI